VFLVRVFVVLSTWAFDMRNGSGLSSNTVTSYVSDLRRLMSFLRTYLGETVTTKEVIEMDVRSVRAWVMWRRNNGNTPRSITRGLAALKCFMRWCIQKEIIEYTSILSIKNPKFQKSLPRPISIEDIDRLITSVEIIKKTNWIIKRDEALFVLIYSVGLRVSEALSLKRADFDNTSGFLPIYGKGGKMRTVPLLHKIKKIIEDYLSVSIFPNAKYLFVNRFGGKLSPSSVQKLFQDIRKWLGLPETVTPHALRHSCATHLMETSDDLRSIQELLGHSSISSTQVYTDVTQRLVTDTYDKCHPLSGKVPGKKGG
jgi:integrase/recombinase XerC